MLNPGADNQLNDTEIKNLHRLETVVERALRTYTEVGEALAGIRAGQLYRGTHSTFEAYLRERWGIDDAVPVRGDGSDAATRACEEMLRVLEAGALTVADLRLTLHKVPTGSEQPAPPSSDPGPIADVISDRLLPQLRWLLTQSAGTIGDVAHQLETHPFDVDDRAREQLRDDVLVIEEELDTLKALLSFVDWDGEFRGLLGGGDSPPDTDTSAEDE